MRKKIIGNRLHYFANLISIVIFSFIGIAIIYRIFNIKNNFWGIIINILGCFLGISIYLIVYCIIHKDRGHFSENFRIILNAMDKIADGDFDIFIETNKLKHYHLMRELSVKINNMAKQLTSMEMMRQDFVANVSHEIQSPLTSIGGFAALLRNRNLTSEEKESYLEIIESETKRLSKLSDNLLKLSALDSGTMELQNERYDLDKQIKNIILSMEPQWDKKNIKFEIECPHTVIIADKELMSQVWINLINNGIKFTPCNGKIYISIKRNECSIDIIIKDTGVGISQEEQKRIFERFFIVDKSRKRELGGNGLGLAITKKIIDLYGGRITVESKINNGASFTVSLPSEM